MIKRLTLVLLILLLPAISLADQKQVTVEIYKFAFTPQQITISPGTTVRWINKEKRQYHSVWFEQLGEPEPDYLFPDDTYERKFDKAGRFPYRCGPHPKMTGVVHVK